MIRHPEPGRPRPWLFQAAPPAILYLLCCYFAFPNTTDDAFITFRYSKHLAEGKGLVFNLGERVEGFSNLLWALLMSAAHGIGLDIVTSSKSLGILFGLGTLALTLILARRHLKMAPSLELLTAAFLGSSIGFVYYSVSGMETAMFAFEVTLLNLALLEERWTTAGLCASALILTRPEGILFTLPAILALLLGRASLKTIALTLLPPAATVIGLELWRLGYYGAWLPNTFHAKISADSGLVSFFAEHTRGFVRYLYASFDGSQAILVLAALGVFVVWGRKFAPLLAAVAADLFFVWFSGGDWMPFGRFTAPVLPLIALLAFKALDRIRQALGRRLSVWAIPAALATLLMFSGLNTRFALNHLRENREVNPAMLSRPHILLGRYLKRVGGAGDAAVAAEVGAIGFYSDLRVIDMLGLTDGKIPALIQRPTLDAYADYIFAQRPRFVLINSRVAPWDVQPHPIDQALLRWMGETGLYRRKHTVHLNYYKTITVYERRP